ncbi:MAG: hypothetical protein JJ957_08690 [Pseudomonadales bacterium]|nr:hypothetical protein [Pseudomonadales bacterium]MBO6564087.1 hypothetical protein [Pseudomonadales bacterium]MBO6822910.1 hypothetical protein [Pseudomonadales bacterium]
MAIKIILDITSRNIRKAASNTSPCFDGRSGVQGAMTMPQSSLIQHAMNDMGAFRRCDHRPVGMGLVNEHDSADDKFVLIENPRRLAFADSRLPRF